MKTIVHYLQNAASGDFQEYDYGTEINLIKYGQTKPPLYDLSRVTSPVAFIYGVKDYFGTNLVKSFLILRTQKILD